MDGIHDLGGRQGFGPVEATPSEPTFAHPWEGRAYALSMLVARACRASGGEFRHSIERMDPAHYLTSPYYEHWITAAATMATEHGLLTLAALEEAAGGRFPVSRPTQVEAAPASENADAAFAVGQRVRVRDRRFSGHTRCPWYVRGKIGTVVRCDGSFSVPDVEAHGRERVSEPTYSIRFEAADLWDDGHPRDVVHVDLWHRYLEEAP